MSLTGAVQPAEIAADITKVAHDIGCLDHYSGQAVRPSNMIGRPREPSASHSGIYPWHSVGRRFFTGTDIGDNL